MPKYLQVSRYLVQDFSVVDFWTVVLESTTQPFFLGAATQRWRTRRRVMAHILKKKKNGCLGDHNFCGQKKGRAQTKVSSSAIRI